MLTDEQVETLRTSDRGAARNRLQVAMELAKVTQVQLAELTGFTQSYISRIKAGAYADLPGETMRRFAQCFGCSIEDLFPAPAEGERAFVDGGTDRRLAERRSGDERRSEVLE